MSRFVETTAREAKTAAMEQAFTGSMDEGFRVTVHSFLNGWLGADWDLSDVLELIDEAKTIGWQDGIAGHDLCVLTEDDRQYNFDVTRPESVVIS